MFKTCLLILQCNVGMELAMYFVAFLCFLFDKIYDEMRNRPETIFIKYLC